MAKLQRQILVVEDDQDTLESMQDALESEGYSVATAVNGEDALEKLKSMKAPCVILLDLMMPVMSGGEFLTVLRDTEALRELPVVVVSAWPDEARKIHSEVQGFVKKPVSLDALLGAVAKFCEPERRAAS